MPSSGRFEIHDVTSFDSNFDVFCESLATVDAALAAALKLELPRLIRGEIGRAQFWDRLNATAGGGS
jgi:hypothetical protein